jgi:hypothetical protein
MKRILFVAAFIVSSSLAACAASLDGYHDRVTRAAIIADGSVTAGQIDASSDAEIRRLVPPSEKVDWQGGSIETDNRWLGSELDLIASESDAAKRRIRMSGIFERLKAIAAEIGEMKRAEAGGTTKDQNKQKIGEILRRPEYQKPLPPEESLFQRWYRKLKEWLNEKFPAAPAVPEAPSAAAGSLRIFLQVLIYALVLGLIGFVILKFGPAFARRFSRRRKEKKSDRVILGERIAAGETGENLFNEAERLAGQGRLRDAIRKGYIAALCELSDRNIVRLARHKTNRDYLRDVRKTRAALVEDMFSLTGTYERNWYGLRMSEAADWQEFRDRYRRAMTNVGSS